MLNFRNLGLLAAVGGACLIGVVSAQAQGAGYTSPHVDTSGQNQQPAYPSTAVANAEQGTVGVDVEVDASGKASHPKLVTSSGYNDLDDAGIAAALTWKYVPAMRNGVPEEERMTVGVNFQLPNAPAMTPKG
jgi:protein TonB